MSFNLHCLFLYLFDKYREVPAVTVGRIIADIIPQTTEAEQQSTSQQGAVEQTKSSTEQLLQFLPEDSPTLCKLLEDLYKRGNILILKNIIEHYKELGDLGPGGFAVPCHRYCLCTSGYERTPRPSYEYRSGSSLKTSKILPEARFGHARTVSMPPGILS